ncbi:MAG: TGS domain-containing protein [Candidatus Latescibacterota bacterium]|nr:MAG: TGS domain-containing protein [Candidatus Latescibacterota bacterium]
MPANLTPQYFAAEEKFKTARNAAEKLKALRGMLSAIPKHKGTEKLQADIKRRISLVQEEEERAQKKGGRGPSPDHVQREGAGQIVIVGEPNTGKSALFAALTGAPPEVAPYPFTTQRPRPGMMAFEDVQIQLVDTPPFSDEYMEPWVPNIPRSGDGLLLAIDLSAASPEDQLLGLLAFLERGRVKAIPEREWAEGPADPVLEKRALLVGLKADLAPARPEEVGDFRLRPASARTAEGLGEVASACFRMLRIIRIYAKMPGHKPDMQRPFTLPIGSTVGDLCRTVHKDFAEKLRFARLWRTGSHQGIQVHRDHSLVDRDVVELHM